MHGIIRRQIVTATTANDVKRIREGLADPGNTCHVKYWGYRSAKNEKWLKEHGLNSRIHRKKPHKRPMSAPTAKANGRESKNRAKVEHVFAHQKARMGLTIRTVGLGPRQDRHHNGEHGIQYESIEMASRSSQNRQRMTAWCPLEARIGLARPKQARIGHRKSRNRGQIRPHPTLINS